MGCFKTVLDNKGHRDQKKGVGRRFNIAKMIVTTVNNLNFVLRMKLIYIGKRIVKYFLY